MSKYGESLSILSHGAPGRIVGPRELVFVDAGIHDYHQLVDDLLARGQDGQQIEVAVLDSNLDGLMCLFTL